MLSLIEIANLMFLIFLNDNSPRMYKRYSGHISRLTCGRFEFLNLYDEDTENNGENVDSIYNNVIFIIGDSCSSNVV